MKAENVIEIEAASPRGHNLYFRPLGRVLRGAFDSARVAESNEGAGPLKKLWPEAIPGQRLGLNLDTGEGYVSEPLHDDRFKAIRKRLDGAKLELEPERAVVKAHVPTWLYWIKRAVDSGLAVVVNGSLPATIDGEPQLEFVIRRQKPSNEKLSDAIREQTAAIKQQSEIMSKLLAELLKKR